MVGHSHFFFVGFDKIVHCGLFFVFVIFYSSELMRQQNTRLLSYKYLALAGIVGILFGGTIELLQLAVFTWRNGEWNDLFADTIGVSMAVFSVWKVNRAVSYEKN
jgi:VanZ family protein